MAANCLTMGAFNFISIKYFGLSEKSPLSFVECIKNQTVDYAVDVSINKNHRCLVFQTNLTLSPW